MSYDPTVFTPITGYICKRLKARAGRISEQNRRYSLSRIVEESLEAHLPIIESRLGIKRTKKEEAS
jgi:hypothetical protein